MTSQDKKYRKACMQRQMVARFGVFPATLPNSEQVMHVGSTQQQSARYVHVPVASLFRVDDRPRLFELLLEQR